MVTRGELYELIQAAISGLPRPASLEAESSQFDAGRLAATIAESVVDLSPADSAEKSVSTRSSGGDRNWAGDLLTKTFLGGFGLFTLFSGLFGGQTAQRTESRRKYLPPSRVSVEGGYDSEAGELTELDYGADGKARSVRPAANVTVNVQAIDSRSFMDHRDDIARAVREALLHSHSLNDVIGDM